MEDATRIADGVGVVYKRAGVYYVRVRIAPNKYIHRTLKTSNKQLAIKAGIKYCHKLEARTELGVPVSIKKFVDVINEYEEFREREKKGGRTKDSMMRQITRVSKFWREFAGKRLITEVNNATFEEFVDWRRNYYHRKTAAELKLIRNYKLNPTDKTMQWEVMLGKAIIKWAYGRGYRGREPDPTYVYKIKKRRVRPAFELSEYRILWRALIKWERDCEVEEYKHTRQLLRDYVLILSNSGMRVGEANNLKIKDVQPFKDRLGRKNYRLIVNGKTGLRDVIPRTITVKYIDRLMARKTNPKPNDWLFAMKDGSKIITLIDQFDKVTEMAGLRVNSHGLKFSLYSLRHFYAVMGLRNEVGVFDIARNMGTSVQIIQDYYGKQATPLANATALGGLSRRHRRDRVDVES